MFDGLSDAAVVETIAAEARASAAADARKYAAIAELQRRRCVEGGERQWWACDDWDGVAAEIGAALNVGHGRASGEMDLAIMLRDRFPQLAALFHAGLLTGRRIWLISQRTKLVTDPDALTRLDEVIADRILGWGPLSEYKLTLLLDVEIQRIDPDAVRKVKSKLRERDFVIADDNESGTTAYWGRTSVIGAAAARERMTTMVRSVCDDDPRTMAARRAAAFDAIMAGSYVLRCECGNPACPAGVDDGRASTVVVHVITDQASLDAVREEVNNEPVADVVNLDESNPAEESEPEPEQRHLQPVAIIPGHGVVPGPLLREVVARGALITPIRTPGAEAEPRYRPSRKTAEFVRARDLTCRAPGCDRPATHADIDHTTPYPAGATHPGNTKCYCRIHHLLKTFHHGWADVQFADGTVVVTSPTGHTYTTKPGISLLFPGWNVTTPTPSSSAPVAPGAKQTSKMPRRKRTRSQTKADRIRAERAHNAQEQPPPF